MTTAPNSEPTHLSDKVPNVLPDRHSPFSPGPGRRLSRTPPPRWFRHLPVALAASALIGMASAQDNAHTPQSHAGAGLKRELIEGITEADFLRLGDKPKTVRITLVASFTAENSGMNFNGYSRGSAVYTIPVGWDVEVAFINPSPVPHSAIVVELEMLRKPQLGEPALKGASTPNPVMGTSAGKASFTFPASEPGEYGLACGIPTHASNGHWVALNISETAKAPTLKLGSGPVKEAGPAADSKGVSAPGSR